MGMSSRATDLVQAHILLHEGDVVCIDDESAVLKSIRLTVRDETSKPAAAALAGRPVKITRQAGSTKVEQPV